MLTEIYMPEIKAENKEKNKATFVVEPLSQGYGMTIGNALRRVLLSSLEGAAPIGIRIKGVSHEFSTIQGVKEDVVEILLNIKKLRVKLTGDEPQTVKINVKGAKKVTAADIEAPSQVEVVNKDLLIATLDGDKNEFIMEIDIDNGRGYESLEKRSEEEAKVNTIALDALYSPVTRVRYNVEATRLGKVIDLDKLVMEIETDGSINPEEAFKKASSILVEQFSILSGAKKAAPKEKPEPKEEKKSSDVKAIQIEEIGLSARAMNAFIANDIKTVGDAMLVGKEELSELKGLGDKAIEELNDKIREFGVEI